jgi:predicted GNAT family N-acyltransferase
MGSPSSRVEGRGRQRARSARGGRPVVVVRRARHGERASAFAVRRRVFIREQHVPEALEWDDRDRTAMHWIAVADGRVVGTVRLVLLPRRVGRLGRLAVDRAWRGRGIGRRLVLCVHRAARRRGLLRIVLASQTAALPFYERSGYRACGPVFDDAGIPHRRMTLRLAHRQVEEAPAESQSGRSLAATSLASSSAHRA